MINYIHVNCSELIINSLYWELVQNRMVNTHGGDKANEIKEPLGIVKYVTDAIKKAT